MSQGESWLGGWDQPRHRGDVDAGPHRGRLAEQRHPPGERLHPGPRPMLAGSRCRTGRSVLRLLLEPPATAKPSRCAYLPAKGRHFTAPFVDGTCMFVPRSTLDAVGMLDADSFAPVGYGADFDYCLRVRSAGRPVVVTRLSYLHHEKQVTARSIHGDRLGEYGTRGDSVMAAGMTTKWGDDWWRLAEINPTTKQTSSPGWLRRAGLWPSRLYRVSRTFAKTPQSRLSE